MVVYPGVYSGGIPRRYSREVYPERYSREGYPGVYIRWYTQVGTYGGIPRVLKREVYPGC